ncbi:sulfatase [Winogradskyella sp. DF17]|uniref:Sulfatase n=1 Tax=Winogradskyella pelagia TaxID=2819984 RepID=A0ABS3SYU4_9FLAO|nr:sulfatase [Winogradskyella sp. DF17]MBO3115657.1 sulfatase [Winogradskyella sp. DF17]
MKNWIYITFVFLAHVSCSDKITKSENLDKSNIVFIITDDHAYQALSAYDDKVISTPNIDRLASEGMLFNKAFVTNSICSPSRAVALTGKFSHLNSVRDNLDVFDTTQVTFPKILRKHGYETAIYGKWHLKSNPIGFDYWEVLPDQGHYYHPEFLTSYGEVKTEGYVTDVITDKAIHYLETLRDRTKPFMLMYNHKAPHRQWWPSMQDLEAFKNRRIPVPESLFDDYKTKSRASIDAEMRIADHMALSADNKIAPELLEKLNYKEFLSWYEGAYLERFNRLTPEEQDQWIKVYGPINDDFEKINPKGKALTLWKFQRYMKDYLGVIKSVDRNVGRLLDYLDDNNLTQNTMVVYTSDQGFFLGEHGWFDKRFMYEESFRTPLLMRYPEKIKPNTINSDLVQNIDFAPTVLDIAGIDIPSEMQGQSLVPLFMDNKVDWRKALYYHYYEYPGIHMVKRHYGIRTKRYKLIRFYYDIEAWELYDLEKDPNEMQNIYNNPEYTEIQSKLHKQLEELRLYYKDSDSLNQMFINSDLKRLKQLENKT